VNTEEALVPDPTSTIPYKRGEGSLEPQEHTPMPTRRRATAPPARRPQFSAVSFILGLFAGVTLTSIVAGVVFVLMILLG